MTHEKMSELLEEFIDEHDLSQALNVLREICYSKAEHVLTNWQDQGLASRWEQMGGRLDTQAFEAKKREI